MTVGLNFFYNIIISLFEDNSYSIFVERPNNNPIYPVSNFNH